MKNIGIGEKLEEERVIKILGMDEQNLTDKLALENFFKDMKKNYHIYGEGDSFLISCLNLVEKILEMGVEKDLEHEMYTYLEFLLSKLTSEDLAEEWKK